MYDLAGPRARGVFVFGDAAMNQKRKRLRAIDRMVAARVFNLPTHVACGRTCPRYTTRDSAKVYAVLGDNCRNMPKEAACMAALVQCGIESEDVRIALAP